MATKTIQLSLPEELLKNIDQAPLEEFVSRSDFIRQAVVARLKEIDEYRVRLHAAATNTDIPTEDEIFRLLRLKMNKRWAKNWQREQRRPDKLATTS